MSSRWLILPLGILILDGCSYSVRENADALVCDLATRPFDLDKLPPTDESTRSQNRPSQPGSDDSKPGAAQPAFFQVDQEKEKAKQGREKTIRSILDRFKI